MESHSGNQMSRALKHTLIATNSILMSLGYVGGSLISRLYFLHGGHRQWLSSFLETAGFPILLLPLTLSYFHRLRLDPDTKPIFMTHRIFSACAVLGVMTGADDFLYAYGLSFLPVSTSVLLLSTHLAFTALFAYLIVKQKFTPFSLNAIALLTVGAVLLGLHASSDRPAGVSRREYYLGFVLTLGAALLYGLVLPLIELTYRKAKQAITYTLVMEMQLVMGFFASLFCFVGMIVSKDFQVHQLHLNGLRQHGPRPHLPPLKSPTTTNLLETGFPILLLPLSLCYLHSRSSNPQSPPTAFTALFAFLTVKQRFTPASLNSVALLTVRAVVLGMHAVTYALVMEMQLVKGVLCYSALYCGDDSE